MNSTMKITQKLKSNESDYSLVIAVAKRAREITQDASDEKVVIDEKPVITAAREFAEGDYRYIEDPSVLVFRNTD